jgi:CMP-N-acetylneuraminic acid synthetase|tara:strand:+ start:14579 stop:15262 length:684 start_codon:yes stop_codon:yes gene_type:complete
MKKKIKYLAVIPARKNSKRIINKNLVKINKKQLVKFTIEAAKKTKKIQEIILSSDDSKILNIAKKYKILPLKRPKEICKDISTTEEAIKHAYFHYKKLRSTEVENIILLQPTSPLRNFKHISECINLFERKKYNSIFSGFSKKDFIWKNKKNKISSLTYNYKQRKNSQKMDKLIFENGAIYIFQTKGFLKYNNRLFEKIGVYLMKKIYSVDIDETDDVKLVEQIFKL